MSFKLIHFSLLIIFSVGCADLNIGRSYLSEMEHDDSHYFNPREDFPVVAGDSGRDWMSDSERRERTPASEHDIAEDQTTRVLKNELRQLESLQTEENLEFYNTHKKALGSTSSRIYFLKLPASERKEYLMTRGIIGEPRSMASTVHERMSAIRHKDILLGMSKQDVLTSWGKPERVDVAGNPRNENERWLYRMAQGPKYIYFESGEVQGWE